jgi:DNA-binding transcriptional LysR family regulator
MAQHDLSDLDAFVAIANARSFRGAAALRDVSPSTLSEAIRRLESRLGVRLLNRTTRSVTPTQAGQKLLDRLKPALSDVEDAIEAMYHDAKGDGGTLRLNVPSAVEDLILPGLVTRFLKAHPNISLEVTADNNFIDVLAAGFDAGIRYDERLERDMIAIPIGPRVQRFVTAASPDYLTQHGTPIHPEDLVDHACIRFRFGSGIIMPWEFLKDGQAVKVAPKGRLMSGRIELLVAGAIEGLGFVHTFEGFLAPAIEAGHLVPVLEDWSERFSGPYLYYASRHQMPGPLRAFVDFVKADTRTAT